MFTVHFDAIAQAHLHELAKTEALRLRREAIRNFGRAAANAFWRGANAIWQHSRQTGQAWAERRASTPRPNPTMASGA